MQHIKKSYISLLKGWTIGVELGLGGVSTCIYIYIYTHIRTFTQPVCEAAAEEAPDGDKIMLSAYRTLCGAARTDSCGVFIACAMPVTP